MTLSTQPQTKDGCRACAPERRRYPRHEGGGLVVELGGCRWPVLDVSAGGLSLRGFDREVGERFRLILMRIGEIGGVAGECLVVSRADGVTRLTFTRPTQPLLHMIDAHVGALAGASSLSRHD